MRKIPEIFASLEILGSVKSIEMVDGEKNVIFPEEVAIYVKSLRKFRIRDIGSKSWMENHEVLVKIHQQTILEANGGREEILKDALILEGKVKILIYNVYGVLTWKHKVLPELLQMPLQPQSSFLIYTIFFHEATIVALLETLLFHGDACEAIEEASLDLIDYCLQAIIKLIPYGDATKDEKDEQTIKEEIATYQKSLEFRIGIRSLSILSFLVENLDKISLSAANRLTTTHDAPCVLSEILHVRPWLRHSQEGFEKFQHDAWHPTEDATRITKAEAQTWFCLRECLLNPRLFACYQVNNFRQQQISKCQGLLHDVLLDQLPPLGDLRQFLATFSVAETQKEKKLLLEELPEIQEKLLEEIEAEGLGNIVKEHFGTLCEGSGNMAEIAATLTKAYNLEALEDLCAQEDAQSGSKGPTCAICGVSAPKKCSQCQKIHYCSRECQVKHWPAHKPFCIK